MAKCVNNVTVLTPLRLFLILSRYDLKADRILLGFYAADQGSSHFFSQNVQPTTKTLNIFLFANILRILDMFLSSSSLATYIYTPKV